MKRRFKWQSKYKMRIDRTDLEKIETDDKIICFFIIDIIAFVSVRGPSLYWGKNSLKEWAKWQVYVIARQLYTPNVERRTRKKHESVLVISCIILTWIYGKLPKIQILTMKFPDCKIHSSWLKDAFINDQCLHFVSSLLLNIPYSYLISRFSRDSILRSFIFTISMGKNDKRSLNFTKALLTLFYFPIKKRVWTTTFPNKLEQVKIRDILS